MNIAVAGDHDRDRNFNSDPDHDSDQERNNALGSLSDAIYIFHTEVPCTETLSIDVVFTVDSSASIGIKNFLILKQTLKKIMNGFSVSPSGPHHIAIIQYSSSPRIITTFEQSQDKGMNNLLSWNNN